MPFLTQGKTNWKFLLIVIVLAVIIGGGIWLLSDLEQEKLVIPEEELTEDIESQTVGWQTYRNNEYGFEIKYYYTYDVEEKQTPGDAGLHYEKVLKEIDFCIGDFSNLTLRIFPNVEKLSIEDFLAEYYKFPKEEFARAKFLEVQTEYGVKAFKPAQETASYLEEFYRQKGIIEEFWSGIPELWFIGNQDYIFVLNLWQDYVDDYSGYSLIELADQMLPTFGFIEFTDGIKVGKVQIDHEETIKLQQSVDSGHQPWRLDPVMVAENEAHLYGFTEEDIKTTYSPHIDSSWVLGRDITLFPVEITHRGKKYEIMVIQPIPGEGKIWTILDINLR